MEREALLGVLILALGGLMLHAVAAWPSRVHPSAAPCRIEQWHWQVLWWPAAPALVMVAWLCGWALSQPDPVFHSTGPMLIVACVPFAIVVLRAVARSVWSLLRTPDECGVMTVGLLRPHIVFSPHLAKRLDARAIEAALAHERAHQRHRDPLRIWVAQFLTDLQWPWGPAQHRFTGWLATLEVARDDEARATGVEGADLAAALLASLRLQCAEGSARVHGSAGLIGSPDAVQARIARLLRPLPDSPRHRAWLHRAIPVLFLLAVALAVVLGRVSGERVIAPLLALCA